VILAALEDKKGGNADWLNIGDELWFWETLV
jgi:hypothetical protein